MGAIGSASAQQLYSKKKEDDPFTRGGRAGLHCKIVVMNGSQRCEVHNLALFRWEGWAWSVCRVAVAILVKSDSARAFEDLPPTQRCIDSVYFDGVRSEALQLSSFIQKKEDDPFTRGGRAGLHCKIVLQPPHRPRLCASHSVWLQRASTSLELCRCISE